MNGDKKIENEKKIKIDIVVPPYSGHLNPVLGLIKDLINDESYDICIHTGAKKKEFLNNLGIKCEVVLKDKPSVFENIVNTSKKTNMFIYYKQFRSNMALVPELVKELEEKFRERKPDVIIADFIAAPAGMIADKLGIPWISSMPTPFIVESKTTTPTYMGGWYPREGLIYKMRDAMGRFVIRNFKRAVCFLARKELKPLGFKLYDKNGEENIYSHYSMLGLGMKELEFRDDFPKQFIHAGPCCEGFDKNEYEFPDTKKYGKVIFLTSGTHVLWGKNDLVEIAKELSGIYPDTCYIVSFGNYSKRNEPVEKPAENIFVYQYADYDTFLPKVDYIIHHGGTGILYNGIKFNKPSVIIPHDYDQFDYAVRAEIAEIGFSASLKSRKSIIDAVGKMLNRKEWKKLEKMSEDFKKYNPSDVLKREINRLIGK